MIACVVPARLKSSRFPNKPLADIMGTPMIIRVLSKIKEADVFSSLYCATDSDEIAELVKSHGFKAIMTKECKTGSDRIAQCLPQIKEKLILNVQGDEPLIDPELLKKISQEMLAGFEGWITAFCDLNPDEIENPNCVKVLINSSGKISEFFRNPNLSIPPKIGQKVYKHIGIYGYSAHTLKEFYNSPSSLAEQKLSLEQLRVFDKTPMRGIFCRRPLPSVDTPEDLKKVLKILENEIEENKTYL